MNDLLVLALALTLLPPHCVTESGGNTSTSSTTQPFTSTLPVKDESSPVTSTVSIHSTSTNLPSPVTNPASLTPSTLQSSLPFTGSTAKSTASPTRLTTLIQVTVATTTAASKPAALVSNAHESSAVSYRHRHHPNHPWGPHFEENVVNITVREFQSVHLDCRVGLIEDKMVSWVRRKADQLDLLTLGNTNHSSDPRFISDFKYPNNWRLGIRNASRNDTGMYLCQISTHPPKVLEVQLTVEAPEVFVISSRGERVQDVYYKEGSTLQLICEVNNVKSRYVNWYHDDDLLNQDITRGGVSIKTDIVADHAKSILSLARITRNDIGTYLCSAPPQNATVTVHILGENQAELYRNGANKMTKWRSQSLLNFITLLIAIQSSIMFRHDYDYTPGDLLGLFSITSL